MSVRTYWFTNYFTQLLNNSPAYGGWKAAGGDAFRIVLMSPAYIPNQDAQAVKADLSGEVIGPGYLAGGQILANKTIAIVAGNLVLGADDVSWGNCTFLTNRAVIYDDANPLPASKQLVCFIDFGQTINLNNQMITLKFDGAGNVTVEVTPPPDVNPPVFGSAVINANPLVITFSEPLNPLSVPVGASFTVLVNGGARVVNVVSLLGSNASLTLAAPVINGDVVTVAYTAPPVNPLEDLDGNNVASFAAQSVSNQTPPPLPPPDTTPPELVNTLCVGTELTLYYSELLNGAVVPATTDYAATVAGALRAVSAISIINATVVMTLASPVSQGQSVRLSYVPGVNKLQDLAGNFAVSLTNISVVNNSPDIVPPVLASATIDGNQLTLTYDKPLDFNFIPAGTAYTVTVNAVAQAAPAPFVGGSQVVLVTVAPVISTDVVKVSYTKPAINWVRDLSGNAAASFLNFSVQNITAPAPPLFDQATFVSQSVPSLSMTVGGSQNVSVVMRNSGTTSWDSFTYQLVSQNPEGNSVWGLSTVPVPTPTPPGSNCTFSFQIKAPSTGGNYSFQWGMRPIGGSSFINFSTSLSIAVSVPVTGRTFYVSVTGNDSNSGTSRSTPFRTINHAADVCLPGDTVYVLPGTYTEVKGSVSGFGTAGIYTHINGTASQRIRFISETRWAAIIRPSSAVFFPWLNISDYVDIQGFDFSNLLPTTLEEPSILNSYASYGNFIENHIHNCPRNCGSGINIRGESTPTGRVASGNNIIGNLIHDLGYGEESLAGHQSYAVYFGYGDGLIANNVLYRLNSYVLYLYHGPNGVNVINNVACYSGAASGIVIGGQEQTAANIYVANNIFAYNSFSGSRVFGVTDYATIRFENNLYFNTTDTSYSGPVTETGLVHADPRFISDSDFHLLLGSPAINTALNKYSVSNYLHTDFDHVARPASGAWERGSYEFLAGTAPVYYMAPAGSDSNNGLSSGAPFKTFAKAFSLLVPGATLYLMDGTYTRAVNGAFSLTGKSGTAASPITIRAYNERKAYIPSDGTYWPCYIDGCSYLKVEGLRCSSATTAALTSSQGEVFMIKNSHYVEFRRLLGKDVNVGQNASEYMCMNSDHILYEECECYNFHRHGFHPWESDYVTYRRCYMNSRHTADVPGYSSGDPTRGEAGISIYPSSHIIIENCISEGQNAGWDIQAAGYGGHDAIDNRIYGSIALDCGYGMVNRCRGSTSDLYVPRDSVVENCAFLNCGIVGTYWRGCRNTQMRNCTMMNGVPAPYTGLVTDIESTLSFGATSFFGTNLLIFNLGGKSVNLTDLTTWSVDYLNEFNCGSFHSPVAGFTHVTALDPVMGAYKISIPATSPMKGAGLGGADIGANIIFRYQDGVLTGTRLWNPSDHTFPHGALIAGVNDVAGSSLFDVNTRLGTIV